MKEGADKTKRIYLSIVACISIVAVLISMTFFITGVVNLVNPNDNFYPRTLSEYKERFVKWDEENNKKIGYEYSEDEMRVMFEEERALEIKIRKTNFINQSIISGLILVISGFLWLSHWDKLKKEA